MELAGADDMDGKPATVGFREKAIKRPTILVFCDLSALLVVISSGVEESLNIF